MEEENKLIINMIEKSIEAFLLGIEIYNKPTIKYRAESFAYHICNAWELALKAYLIKKDGLNTIYYRNKSGIGTISLKKSLSRVFTNKLDPTYKNLEDIIKLRNTSTHFIVEEYNSTYVHLFQSCAYNYYNFLNKKINTDLINKINFDFILLITPNKNKDFYKLNGVDEKILNKFNTISSSIKENANNIKSENYSINVNYILSTGEQRIRIDGNSTNVISVKDINSYYPYKQKEAIFKIIDRLKKEDINANFSQNSLTEWCKYFGLKENTTFFTKISSETQKTPTWLCNEQLVDFVVSEFKKDPNAIINIRNKLKEKQNKDSSE